MSFNSELTPHQIVTELDRYIIGQRDAKKSVAIALRNRWRRLNASLEMREEIMPNNIIMIGPTGVGKTEIARRLAKLSGAPFIKVEATKFTEVGYVGRDVDSMIRDLTDIAINMVREEHTESVQEKAKAHAEDRILDLLIPPAPVSRPVVPENTLPAPSTETGTESANDEESLRNRTRDKFRKKLRAGDLDDRELEIDVTADGSPMLQVFGPMGMEEMGVNFQDILGNLGGGKKSKKRRMPVSEARELLTQEEANKLIDMDKVTKQALTRVQQAGIVFIDEIDKVASRSGSGKSGPDVSREGVQRDLLPIVEGSGVMTKYGMVKTDHILFIASGAFHIAKPSDLIPELQGRFPIRVELTNLTEDDFYKILTVPKNALLKQYQALLASEGVTVDFKDEAVKEVASMAAAVNEEVENIGARRLHTILTTLLEDILFDVPDAMKDDSFEVDKAMVQEKLSEVVENRDLSQYIL
ncbi:MAG: ATP-dependent protease ATPase subunit HslU [Rhodothermales bacterium]|nr:ATP-dependent protease ATPase subunit HslU [Rhodothermales bacterium]MDG2017725.1 ATP-dependent protease ATPase subunit HslU [Rhodothermales bacterium]